MNAKTWRAFKKLQVINESYRALITGQSLDTIPVVVVPETILATTTGSATVVLGDFSHYLVLTNGAMKQYQLDDPLAMNRATSYHFVRNGKARFADSFAKFTVSGL